MVAYLDYLTELFKLVSIIIKKVNIVQIEINIKITDKLI